MLDISVMALQVVKGNESDKRGIETLTRCAPESLRRSRHSHIFVSEGLQRDMVNRYTI